MLVSSSAKLRFVSIPPRKMRLVANMVKGMPVQKALGVLNFSPRIAAQHMAKTVKSAAANALSREGTDNLRPEDLMIRQITVDAAPTAKRIRFQSMGRVFRYRKRFCHLTVEIEGQTTETPESTGKKAAVRSKKASPSKDGQAKSKEKATTETKEKRPETATAGTEKAVKVATKDENEDE